MAIVATPMFWLMYGQLDTFAMFVCGSVAIPAGHLGQRRAKYLGGRDRGLALVGILAGWLLLLVAALLVPAYGGLIIGLTFLLSHTR